MESVTLNKTTIPLNVGDTETLTATVKPDEATDKTVKWSSSNESVATVDNNGMITAVAAGTATITATATNGTDAATDDKTATCTVTVNAADEPDEPDEPDESMTKAVEIINVLQNGSRAIPPEFKNVELSLKITIDPDSKKSASDDVELTLSAGGEAVISREVTFSKKIDGLAPGKFTVTVSGLPKSVYAKDADIYSTDGPIEGAVKWKYALSAKGEINEIDGKPVVRVWLIWDNGSLPETIRVVALPEDEIGAYQLRADGTKEYLLFQTYDICMAFLGRDELCRGYERCFHK